MIKINQYNKKKMLHLWIIKICLLLGHYMASIGYPLLETHKALEEKKRSLQWVKVITYWIIFLVLSFFDRVFFFISQYFSESL